jgi:hypothetical protein
LGAGEYLTRFTEAGYDLGFVMKSGLTDADLDCVGIPHTKRGIRRKIIELHDLDKFADVEGGDESGDDDSDDDDDDDEDEDGSESEDDDD